ncbi:hypothetical protein DICVIV_13985 [Dictyocaulus viviparus]|uniref:Uncharacterized protein n=1 Tax=Dictyocaulus viviparus TaxID=29172 RepID=A0A0D8XC87_DICVI|nr:hypothetical protein DICVIV_13985 [Dictyocaulus viviparus]
MLHSFSTVGSRTVPGHHRAGPNHRRNMINKRAPRFSRRQRADWRKREFEVLTYLRGAGWTNVQTCSFIYYLK